MVEDTLSDTVYTYLFPWSYDGRFRKTGPTPVLGTPVHWAAEGKVSSRQPETTRHRTVEAEMRDYGYSWCTMGRLAKDRTA